MACCKNNEYQVTLIQGDIFESFFEIDGIEKEFIAAVYFTSEKAGISTTCPYSEEDEAYCLRFNSKQTELFKPAFCTYDLTVELTSGGRITVIRNQDFVILEKNNKIVEIEEDDANEEPSESDGESS